MTTPSKNFNYNSPYAKPVQQYPSQSEDYISLDMGGPTQANAAANSSNEKTPGRYNLKYYQQNYKNSSSKANRRNLFNNNYGQQNRQNYQQQSRFGGRNSNERFPQQKQNHHNSKTDAPIASYCHPSMTEDPWFELMQRIQALEKSKISVKEISLEKDLPPPDTCSNSDSDNDEVDSAASD